MEYYAHITEDKKRRQSVKSHLTGTAELAAKFAGKFGKSDWGYCCGMLHDIGKYSIAFQDRLLGKNSQRVDHSTAGAQLCLAQKGTMYWLAAFCIAGHHAGIPDYGSSANGKSLLGRNQKQIPDYQAYQNEIEIPQLKNTPFDPDKTTNFFFSLSVFVRMLYSCLVDADFLDTEQFMNNGNTVRDSGENMEILSRKLENYISVWLSNPNFNTVNGRRTEILKHCLECGKARKGLFRLTVPTGGGKTVASLAFALRHAVHNHMDRVIYAIPYTSIIEQNAQVFRDILGDQNVLENHYNVEYDGSEELKLMQMAAENWDKPVVVTTNVQFFESLFGNKSSRCRKLHNIANSVIVLDEAQMLPNEYLKPCIAMLEELISNYGVSIVLCTATQPALTDFFSEDHHIIELCPRIEEQFQFFRRTQYRNIGIVTEESLIERLKGEEQALCIVNTKKKAQILYQKMKKEGVYHLSTTMYPKHRRRVLEQIRERLRRGEKCVVISTSLVEAGVDLDFCTVYRQLAGVDSMIQAAGRCNREGRRNPEESLVFIFQFEGKENVPGQRQQIEASKYLLSEGYELSSLETVEEYFRLLYQHKGENLDNKKIMEEFQNGKYNFAKVGEKFHFIEENTKTVFIPKEVEAVQLLLQIRRQGFTKSGIRKAGQYCVQVYDNDLEKLNGAGMLRLVSEDMRDFYELVNTDQYTEETGLELGIDSGIAVLF